MADHKSIHIIGGGTVAHITNHLALSAQAYGSTARKLTELCKSHPDNIVRGDSPWDDKPMSKLSVYTHLTKMAGGSELETNEDIAALVDKLIAANSVKIIFFNAALVDYVPRSVYAPDSETNLNGELGKHAGRIETRKNGRIEIHAVPSEKIINRIRKARKDIFLVAFKTTCGATEDEQYIAGLNLLKEASCNLVLANDVKTRVNMIITPEEARYHVTTYRDEVLAQLVDMALLRSHLTFTRSTVISGEPVAWDSPLIPETLRKVVDACIKAGAYKPFRGATVGHFAYKVNDTTFLTSRRKTNFNDLEKLGLVKIETDGPDKVLAYGYKPSVGGQSQRIVFAEHPDYDCIVHFHCPLRPLSERINAPMINGQHYGRGNIRVMSQREFECGSHECGQNTSNGLVTFSLGDGQQLSAVHLDNHGPNLVFHHSVDPQRVVDFINANWDLTKKTGGYVILPA